MSILDDIEPRLEGVRRYSKYIAAVCPFHADTSPSLLIYEDWYVCKSPRCGEEGPTERLLSRLNDISYIPRPKLSQKRTMNPFTPWKSRFGSVGRALKSAHTSLQAHPHMGSYLWGRGMTPELAYRKGIGRIDDWFTFPVWGSNNKLLGAYARNEDSTYVPRHIVPPRQNPHLLYVCEWGLLRKCDKVYLTFGIFDAWSIVWSGRAAMSTLSGLSLDPTALDWLRKPIVIVPDYGEEAEARKLASQLGWRGKALRIDYPDGTKDLNEVYIKYGDLNGLGKHFRN